MKDIVKNTSNISKKNKNSRQNQQVHRKKRRRKKNMSLYYLTVFVVVSSALVVLSMTVFFKIDNIKVSGSSVYSKEQVIAASGIKKGENLIRADIDSAKDNILKTLVMVDDVKIKRKFPSELTIEIVPSESAAQLKNGDEYIVISRNGKILEDKLTAPKSDLQIIEGYDPVSVKPNTIVKSKDDKKDTILKEFLTEIEKLDFKGIDSIDISDRLNIKFKYQNRIDVELGSSQDLEYKINFVYLTIKEKVTDEFKGKIVMRGMTSGASIIPSSN